MKAEVADRWWSAYKKEEKNWSPGDSPYDPEPLSAGDGDAQRMER